MRKKKNRFLLFCFSFLPGAGEMYYGFMKTGVSLLSLFALAFMATFYTNMSLLGFIIMIIWVYGFFHANNLGTLSDEEFYRLKDEYLFGIKENDMDSIKEFITGKYRKVFAALLILVGVSMLWQTFCRFLRFIMGNEFYYKYIAVFTRAIGTDVPRLLISIAIIWVGFKLIMGKKKELDMIDEKEEAAWRAAEEVKPQGTWQQPAGEMQPQGTWQQPAREAQGTWQQPMGEAQPQGMPQRPFMAQPAEVWQQPGKELPEIVEKDTDGQ